MLGNYRKIEKQRKLGKQLHKLRNTKKNHEQLKKLRKEKHRLSPSIIRPVRTCWLQANI